MWHPQWANCFCLFFSWFDFLFQELVLCDIHSGPARICAAQLHARDFCHSRGKVKSLSEGTSEFNVQPWWGERYSGRHPFSSKWINCSPGASRPCRQLLSWRKGASRGGVSPLSTLWLLVEVSGQPGLVVFDEGKQGLSLLHPIIQEASSSPSSVLGKAASKSNQLRVLPRSFKRQPWI